MRNSPRDGLIPQVRDALPDSRSCAKASRNPKGDGPNGLARGECSERSSVGAPPIPSGPQDPGAHDLHQTLVNDDLGPDVRQQLATPAPGCARGVFAKREPDRARGPLAISPETTSACSISSERGADGETPNLWPARMRMRCLVTLAKTASPSSHDLFERSGGAPFGKLPHTRLAVFRSWTGDGVLAIPPGFNMVRRVVCRDDQRLR
jgi:hypothetical protein